MQNYLAYRYRIISVACINLLFIFVMYFLWAAIYEHRDSLQGLSFEELFLFLGLSATLFVCIKVYMEWEVAESIRSGDIVNYLTRPMDYQAYMATVFFGKVLVHVVVIAIPTAFLVFFLIGDQWQGGSYPFWWLIPISLALMILTTFFIDFMAGCLSFYTESIWGLMITKETMILAFSGAMIPFQLFPEEIKDILLWTPFPYLFYVPVQFMVGSSHLHEEMAFSWILRQGLWVFILGITSRWFYLKSLKVVTVNGG